MPGAAPEGRDEGSVGARLREVLRDTARAGRPLPSEPALASSLGVSRPALREELARLETEGLIRRRRGADTIVNPAGVELSARFDQQREFDDVLRSAGFRPAREVLAAGVVRLDGADAERLGVAPGSPALRTTKRWLADGTPAMLAIDVIPAAPSRVDRLDDVDPGLGLFELVDVLRGERVEWELALPSAAIAAGEVRRGLGLGPRAAVLQLELFGVVRAGGRAYHAVEHHVPGVVPTGFVRSVRA